MVKSVRQFVNESIQMAYETKSPVLFLAYANVPIIVAKCNEEAERGLGYCPEQVAKCGKLKSHKIDMLLEFHELMKKHIL